MLYSALLLGLLSSLHCIGMCGPIAMMLPLERNNPAVRVIQLLTYHGGRITAYGVLGTLFGLMGQGFSLAVNQQLLSIIAGILMITIIMIPEKVFARYNFSKPIYRFITNIKTILGSQLRKKGTKAFFLTGLFNGFLPCGLVYAALFGAIATQSVLHGTFYMMLYGLGTVPLMSAVVYTVGFIKASFRNTLYKIVPFAVVAIGMLFIVRGLGLGIANLSPGKVSLFVKEMPACR